MEKTKMLPRSVVSNMKYIDDMRHIKATDELIGFRVRQQLKINFLRAIKAYGYFSISEALRMHMLDIVHQAKNEGVIE